MLKMDDFFSYTYSIFFGVYLYTDRTNVSFFPVFFPFIKPLQKPLSFYPRYEQMTSQSIANDVSDQPFDSSFTVSGIFSRDI